MELFEEDYYLVEKPQETNINIVELFALYEPLVGSNALALYCTLLAESRSIDQFKHSRLCKLMNISIDEIEMCRVKLEQYGLLKTFFSSDNNSYIYKLIAPLYGQKFFDHYVYGLKFKNVMGLNDYEISRKLYLNGTYSIKEYKDVTAKLNKQELLNISEQEAKEFIDTKIDSIKEDDSFGFSSLFDYQKFTRGLTSLTFPNELRTNDNMRFIGRLSTMSNIPLQKLRELTCQSIDFKNKELRKDLLLKKVLAENDITLQKSGYSVSPLQFLQAKQDGVKVSLNSTKILEYLVNDTDFSTEVINIIIEFALDQSDNKLARNYVEQIAETFARSNVKTEQDALNLVKKLKKDNKKEVVRYQNIKKASNKIVDEVVDEEELRKKQKELLELFGK